MIVAFVVVEIKIIEIDYKFFFKQNSKIIFIDKKILMLHAIETSTWNFSNSKKKNILRCVYFFYQKIEISIHFIKNVHFHNFSIKFKIECRIDFIVFIQNSFSNILKFDVWIFFEKNVKIVIQFATMFNTMKYECQSKLQIMLITNLFFSFL